LDIEQLNILEKKIAQAVGLIDQLKTENQKLKTNVNQFQAELESKDLVIKQLKEENQNLKLMQNNSVLEREKEEQIRSKVEQMLNKLDELQYI
jgi:FtsZ-binding cell division protein ZapB